MTSLAEVEQRVAVVIFKSEVLRWASRIGVQPKEVHARSMKRKWASCSTNGRLTFAEHLLAEPTAFGDEVIVHELLHLKIPNHGKLSRALLRAHLAAGRGRC